MIQQASLFTTTMTEKLLQFLWQHQYFTRSDLRTTDGEPVEVVLPGRLNTHQGPDFLDAQVRIGSILLVGSVELHLKASQWLEHGHQHDGNYANVILHVVLEEDAVLDRRFPVLELGSRIPRVLLEKYAALMASPSFIPCGQAASQVRELTWISWKDRLAVERLTRKSRSAFAMLEQNKFHWEETFWWLLARGFGAQVNADAFEAVARSLPLNLIGRHKHLQVQLEALLLGQARLLGNQYEDDYARLLYREYEFLKKKFGLQPVDMPVHYLRMRPGNFPTVRLAQLAAVLHGEGQLFGKVLQAATLDEVRQLFLVTANDYWHYRYLFDEPSSFRKKSVGKDMADKLIINTVVPLVFAYGLHGRDEARRERALGWLEQLAPERNSVTEGFRALGIPNESAFSSQALLELRSRYCMEKRCLECAIGQALLNG